MSRLEAWLLHVANLLVVGTGVAYALFRYFLKPDDPFANAHPWQAPAQHAHVVVAPLLVFGLGLIFRSHVWAGVKLDVRARRRSGLTLLAGAAPMIVSGYLLQVAVEPSWRTAWIWVHLSTGTLWLLSTAVHQLTPKVRSRPQ